MSTGLIRQYTYDYLDNHPSIDINSIVTLGITYEEKDPFFKTNSQYQQYRKLNFIINNTTVSMGKTDMYEITQPMNIGTIIFPEGVPYSIQVNICGYSKEQEE